jgi:cytochrome P450
MPTYDAELLAAAHRLLRRSQGQPGKLSGARIRRSISTSYYVLFHFLIEEAGLRLVGSHNDLRRRRRILARAFTHAGIKTALDKVRGTYVEKSIEDFLRTPGAALARPVSSPLFAQNMAKAFSDAQAKRHDADYDLNKVLSETDARLLRNRAKRAIRDWRSARAVGDRDFKRSLCMLMLLKGQLRKEN